ncbi:MAG: TOBE domain-containing protein [Thiohalocapsa sp.]|jgi:molybdate transport system regulatory protein|uniref:TOBE domain-containing protein n=1 Tax=Thiohalocapsa sp. TaxID=2497641 RepID=UPI0025E962BC|nr:TOBE domain-containing protein [Thiohalocapsa sp.]MCG6942011.1 TOBE domain-containing protein [Thiohalocapsa sp.]
MTTPRARSPRLVGRLSLATELGDLLGDTRIRLLEAIGRHGSIARAAKAVPMSYRAAWDALDAMNNLTAQPLVESSIGGRDGGGTRLTAHGRRLVALYRAVEHEYQEALDRLGAQLDLVSDGDEHAFRALLSRMSLHTSARNRFAGTLVQLSTDQVGAHATVRLGADTQVTALLTRESAEAFALKPGAEVQALVKATAVMLGTGRGLRTSAANQLWGEVSRIREGPLEADVTLRLPGDLRLAALITRAELEQLDLRPGREACAVFQASSVILASCA